MGSLIDEKEYVLHAFLEAQCAHGFVTGKERVENDDVGLGEDGFGNEFGAVGFDDHVATSLEDIGESANGGGVLIDDHNSLLRLALIEQGVDFVEEGRGVNGLGEIAIDAEAEAALLILDDGEDDDGDVHGGGVVLQDGCHVESVHLGHHDIEDDQAGCLFADEGEGFDLNSLPDPLANENLLRHSGRGLLLIQAFMDEFQMRAREPKGTEVKMVKYVAKAN